MFWKNMVTMESGATLEKQQKGGFETSRGNDVAVHSVRQPNEIDEVVDQL